MEPKPELLCTQCLDPEAAQEQCMTRLKAGTARPAKLTISSKPCCLEIVLGDWQPLEGVNREGVALSWGVLLGYKGRYTPGSAQAFTSQIHKNPLSAGCTAQGPEGWPRMTPPGHDASLRLSLDIWTACACSHHCQEPNFQWSRVGS